MTIQRRSILGAFLSLIGLGTVAGVSAVSTLGKAPAAEPKLASGWRAGPLPPDTYWWGGVVLKSQKPINGVYTGFFMASFCGDHVEIHDRQVDRTTPLIVQPEDIVYYNNSLQLPCSPLAG